MAVARSPVSGYPSSCARATSSPWTDCDTDAERLDIFNGLLLAAHLDAAFDAGFITIAEDGTVLPSNLLPPGARSALGLDKSLKVRGLRSAHERYLPWHRHKVFRTGVERGSK